MTTVAPWMQQWQNAYPYIVNKSTGIKLGDYNDARRKFMDAWGRANPYTGVQPDTNSSMAFSPATWEQGWTPTANDYEAIRQAADYNRAMEDAWGQMLTPEQGQEYAALRQAESDRKARLAKIGAIVALGGIAGAGALGAGMFGSGVAGEGLGMAGWLPEGATFSAEGLPSISSIYGAGSGWGADTLNAMGLGEATTAGTSVASGPWGEFLKTLGTKAGGSLLSNLIAAGGNAYMGNKNANMYNNYIQQINSLFAPDSPYAKQMQQAMERKDAAAGRNSQYGTRAVELAAALTRDKANALTSSGFQNMLGQYGTNSNSIVNGFLAALGSQGGQDLITKAGGSMGGWLSKLFGSNGNQVSPTSPNIDSSWMPDWMALAGD